MRNLCSVAPETEPQRIGQLAADILLECSLMDKQCQASGTAPPSLEAGASTAFWSETSTEIATARTRTLGLLDRLSALLLGPHDLLAEFVASNWDQGALYAFLRSQTLEHIHSSGGHASLSSISEKSGVPEDKLVRILGLLRCKNIVHEPEDDVYALTAVSEALVSDADFKAWVEFQLFETRVASAHLSEALASKPNGYADGTTGFKQGWGVEMYEWHARHPEKGDRFRRAMSGVSASLDPGDAMIRGWFQSERPSNRTKVVEFGGRYGFASVSLVAKEPKLTFEVRCDSQEFLRRGEALAGHDSTSRITFTHVSSLFGPLPLDDSKNVLVYVIRNLFWNWTDDDAVKLLKTLLPTLRITPSIHILVTDGISPSRRDFPPHVEVAYRRRDVTTMTMHNVKQRTQAEWLALFSRVDPALKASRPLNLETKTPADMWAGSNKICEQLACV
ncbi:MAG: hypothetical protein Q9195_005545 [Heterodermia aff. obscurata]